MPVMNPRFLSKLECTPLADDVNWRLTRDLRFIDERGDLHVVHAGFVTDFASIPDLDRLGVVIAVIGWVLCVFHGWPSAWRDALGLMLLAFGIFMIWICPDLNRDDQLDAPAVLHDEGYGRARYGKGALLMKFYWDWLLFLAMRANKEPLWKCWLIWANVAAFGWFAWYSKGKRKGHHRHD